MLKSDQNNRYFTFKPIYINNKELKIIFKNKTFIDKFADQFKSYHMFSKVFLKLFRVMDNREIFLASVRRETEFCSLPLVSGEHICQELGFSSSVNAGQSKDCDLISHQTNHAISTHNLNWLILFVILLNCKQLTISLYTVCPGKNVPDFGRMFLKLK